uniref:Uncharacterized protein n=1 Tax=Clytia hemisphaerica TaxID=252671 RepID=A0A7M5VB80_9CNID
MMELDCNQFDRESIFDSYLESINQPLFQAVLPSNDVDFDMQDMHMQHQEEGEVVRKEETANNDDDVVDDDYQDDNDGNNINNNDFNHTTIIITKMTIFF